VFLNPISGDSSDYLENSFNSDSFSSKLPSKRERSSPRIFVFCSEGWRVRDRKRRMLTF
jgi:hypothetical protein